jgi:hypothetical protein
MGWLRILSEDPELGQALAAQGARDQAAGERVERSGQSPVDGHVRLPAVGLEDVVEGPYEPVGGADYQASSAPEMSARPAPSAATDAMKARTLCGTSS